MEKVPESKDIVLKYYVSLNLEVPDIKSTKELRMIRSVIRHFSRLLNQFYLFSLLPIDKKVNR